MTMKQVLRRIADRSGIPYHDLFRTMLSVTLTGTVHKRREDADAVGAVVEASMTDPAKFHICRALALGIAGDASYAVAKMLDRIDRDPEDDMAKVVLGAAKRFAGESDWQFSIDNVLALSTNQPAREMAMKVLEFLKQLKLKSA